MLVNLAAGLLLCAMSAHAGLDLKPISPDEPADYTFNQRFSVDTALRGAKQLESILASFRKLTEKARRKLDPTTLKEIGNTDGETQTIAFANLPRTIQGTVLKQDYLIKKLQYELALEKSKTGQVTAEKVAETEKEYKKAEEAFQALWNGFRIAD